MSVRRRAVKARVDRDRRWKAQFDATTASLEQLRRELPRIWKEYQLVNKLYWRKVKEEKK